MEQFGLILTHNISTVIVAIFSFIYLLLNINKIGETRVKKELILNIIFIIFLSLFFTAPMIETKLTTKYQVYEKGMMATSESTADSGLNINQLFVTLNDGSYVFELGPHIIIMLAFSIMTIRRINPEIKFQYIFFLISGIITLFMSTKYFPWRYLPQVFSYIQFPWRILMMSSFFLSVVCSINMYIVIKNFNYKDVIVISAISIIYIIAFASILIKQIDNIDNIKDINLGFISGKEHEVIAGMGKEEYLPSNAYNNRFYIATRDNNIYVLEGKAIIEEETKNGTNYNAQIKTLDSEYTAFELPYIYYPGYVVRLDGMIVDTFETANGFLGFVMYSNDQAELEVSYEGTNVMKISSLISFISFIAFSIYVWKKR